MTAVRWLAVISISVGAGPAGAQEGMLVDTACVVMGMPTAGRLSPLDSLSLEVAGHPVKVCYGRPSARGRTMLGGKDVPYGQLWRTGANEPTMIHTTAPVSVAGIALGEGSYSLYSVPGENEWVIIVNRSITQWGHIARYTSRVKAQEVGRATIRPERSSRHVETLTLRAELGARTALILEWEHTRVRIPIAQSDL